MTASTNPFFLGSDSNDDPAEELALLAHKMSGAPSPSRAPAGPFYPRGRDDTGILNTQLFYDQLRMPGIRLDSPTSVIAADDPIENFSFSSPLFIPDFCVWISYAAFN